MEEIYTLDNLTLREVRALRQGLNAIDIKGIDAMFIATLQIKMNDQIKQIEDHINEDKRKAIEEEIKRDTQPAPKSKSKKS
tara:strand:- start:179 stop:421 length:243 start_codon:yes stop_codon:yes gene_type:complete